MKKKLSLELEALAVDSFETSAAGEARGTVQGRGGDPEPTPPEYGDCTCDASCLCPTNAYYCATVQETVVSCDYTFNGSCLYDTGLTSVTCGGYSCNRCTD